MISIKFLSNSIFHSIYCLFLFIGCVVSSGLFAYSDESDSGTTTSFHNGLPYCRCFIHCSCFGHCVGNYDVCFPEDNSSHPRNSIDKAWHEFMKGILTAKKVGPFFILDPIPLKGIISFQNDANRNVHSISDYLEIIEKFRGFIANARLQRIESEKNFHSSPKEKKKLEEKLKLIEQEYRDANRVLNEVPSRIIPLYQEAIKSCKHNCLFSVYNKGLIHSMTGQWEESLAEIRNLIDLFEKNNMMLLDSKVYQTCGEACLEVNLFNEAINALTTAISKNPKNKQAYFYRASAYFENGNFDQALQDYLMSDKGKSISTNRSVPKEFAKALIKSTCQGASEAAVDFVPSLCSSVHGLGTTLWAAHPLNPEILKNAKNFANACYEMSECVVEYCKNVDWNTVDDYILEIRTLYERFDQLSVTEKGVLFGHTIGKYGVDAVACSLTGAAVVKGGGYLVKGASAFRNLKNVNRACNLEAMAVSNANKEIISANALKHAAERESFLKTVKIEVDKQNKHVVGEHNFRPGNGEFVHSDPQNLLSKFAGKGKPINDKVLGTPDYRERVDFGEFIGYYVNDQNPDIKLPTTKGTIRYSKKGAHIIPSHPDGK